jgi:hypothetical protein
MARHERLPNGSSNARTQKLERAVAELLTLPLLRENVFHSARYADAGVEKELCDVLLMHRGKAMIVSVKAQGADRNRQDAERWLQKAASKAVAQIAGACRTLRERSSWCEQDGERRELAAGEVLPVHGVALVESSFECCLTVDDGPLARARKAVPVTFMTLNDFVAVASYLRTWRDLDAYLTARTAALAEPDRSTVGAERALFSFYTVMRDSFASFRGISDAKIVAAAGRHVVEGSAFRDRERGLAAIFEEFLAQISTCGEMELPAEEEHLSAHLGNLDVGKRRLRDELCELGIQDRAALGEQIGHVCGRVAAEASVGLLVHGAVRLPTQPDKVYVIVAGWNAAHGEAGLQALDLGLAACHHYERRAAVVLLINQVGDTVRTTLGMIENVAKDDEYAALGEELYGHIKPRRVEPRR